MTDSTRDPYECSRCGTVNAWNQEECRTCGVARDTAPKDPEINEIPPSRQAENVAPPPSVPTPSHFPAHRRWNAFWIFFGIAIHVVTIHMGAYSILKVFIEPDPQLRTTIEKTLEAARNGEAEKAAVLDNLPEAVQSKISIIRWSLMLLLIASPFLIGVITGFFSRTVLEAAAAMGLSAALILVLNNLVKFAVPVGLLNAGIGAFGGYIGYKLAERLRRPISAK